MFDTSRHAVSLRLEELPSSTVACEDVERVRQIVCLIHPTRLDSSEKRESIGSWPQLPTYMTDGWRALLLPSR